MTAIGEEWIAPIITDAKQTRHRRGILLSGRRSWCIQQAQILREYFADSQALFVGTDGESWNNTDVLSHGLARSALGRESAYVVVDCHERFDPDVIAAMAGVVSGGGLFVILCPRWDDRESWAEAYASRLVVEGNQSPHRYAFVERFRALAESASGVFVVVENMPLPENSAVSTQVAQSDAINDDWCRTACQAQAVSAIKKTALGRRQRPLVLVSDRGRGKSSALGIAAGQLLITHPQKITIIGPNRRSIDPVLSHVRHILRSHGRQDADGPLEELGLRFMVPAELASERPESQIVLVDEAATISVPLLVDLLLNTPRIVFATTVHGYEGTGRGFAIRFRDELDAHRPAWREVRLTEPIRWADGDPIEAFIGRALVLGEATATEPDPNGDLNVDKVPGSKLARDDELLTRLFGLLIDAHYRTAPSDLMRLLDAPNGSVWVARRGECVLGALFALDEGGFDQALARSVFLGRRRPQGHFLPSYLSTQPGLDRVGGLRGRRIARIAVAHRHRRTGVATLLLKHLLADSQADGIDYLGAIFGASKAVLDFWGNSDFALIHVGEKRGKSTGFHSAVVYRTLSEAGRDYLEQATAILKETHSNRLSGPWTELDVPTVVHILKRVYATTPLK